MNNTPIVAFANTAWSSLWMNRQHLLSRLAAGGRRIAFSNGVVHFRQVKAAALRQRAVWQDDVLLMQRGYFVPGSHRESALRRVALRYHCARIRDYLDIGHDEPVIGMCFDPGMIDYIDALEPTYRHFHIYDSYNKMGIFDTDFLPLRRRIREFDLVTASSAYMYEDVIGYVPDPRFVVANGVDYAGMHARISAPSLTAAAVSALPGVKIGYVGSINTKIDFELIFALASALPVASFVFVGPIRTALLQRSAIDYASFERLRALPNVHFFGQVPTHELAAVLAAMDVNCIYFRIDRDDWVKAVYPLKLNEYLAIGKPIVCTPIKVVCDDFTEVVRVADGTAEWLQAIRESLAEADGATSIAKRQAVAASNDWSQRVAQLEALFGTMQSSSG